MKSYVTYQLVTDSLSLPPRGAWIEISDRIKKKPKARSLPPRGAWIEILEVVDHTPSPMSLPPRGAWIEIPGMPAVKATEKRVAPPTGSVD